MDQENHLRLGNPADHSISTRRIKANDTLRITMNKTLKSEICTALTDSAVLFIEHDAKLVSRHTLESNYVMNVFGITHLAERIIRTRENLSSLQTNKFTKGTLITYNKLGRSLRNALNTDVPDIRNHFPTHEFNPYFELFVRHARDRGLDYGISIRNAYTKEEITRANDILQGFVNALRQEGQSTSFKAKLRSFQRNPNKNCQSLNRYLRKTLAQHIRIHITRLDLSYQRDASSPIIIPNTMSSQTIKAHREAFLKLLKKSEVSEHLIGYAWKMEGSAVKGFLHHMMLVLDETSISNQATISEILQKIWGEVTEGNGLLVDCSTLAPSCKSEGTGLLEHSSKDACAMIRKICNQMTQTDYYIKLNLPNGGRAFGRAEVVKKKNKSVITE